MFTRLLALAMAVAGFLFVALPTRAQERQELAFSGPFTHDNLTILLIHGPDILKGRTYLSLQEGLEQKKITVYETGNVNELQVENTSPTEDVFIQAGEIVKGGRQDRVLSMDLIVPANSGKLPVAAYCVEHGRWSQRGGEDSGKFGSSSSMVSGNGMKLATSYVPSTVEPAGSQPATGQGAVWATVAENQRALGGNVGGSVVSSVSGTSLQLTLEDSKVREAVKAYVGNLQPVVQGKADVIGFAVAVNGKIRTVDVYASNGLFLKLWPKVLDSAATQAVAELEKGKKFDPVASEDVKKFMLATAGGQETRRDVNGRIEMTQVDTQNVVQFRARDTQAPAGAAGRGGGGGAVHRSWVGK